MASEMTMKDCSKFKDREFPNAGGIFSNQTTDDVLALTTDFNYFQNKSWAKFVVHPSVNTKKNLCVFDTDVLYLPSDVLLVGVSTDFGSTYEPTYCVDNCLIKIPDFYELNIYEYFGLKFAFYEHNQLLHNMGIFPKILTEQEVFDLGISLDNIPEVNPIYIPTKELTGRP